MTNYDILKEYEDHKTPIPSYEEYEQLEEENNKLKQAIKELGGMKCCKCGEYHNRHYVCWHCGYDDTAPKEVR